jgi:hypothetical protein
MQLRSAPRTATQIVQTNVQMPQHGAARLCAEGSDRLAIVCSINRQGD